MNTDREVPRWVRSLPDMCMHLVMLLAVAWILAVLIYVTITYWWGWIFLVFWLLVGLAVFVLSDGVESLGRRVGWWL